MALLKCPDCGNMVSDRAPFCTKCGCPIDCIIKESKTINKEDNSLLHKSAKKIEPFKEQIHTGMELWHEKYGIGTVTGIEDLQTGKIISVDFNGDERKFLYPTAMDVNLFTLDKVPKNSRYYKVMQERIEKEKKESLLLKRQKRLHSRESVVISCENEIEKDEERKIRELRKPANTEMENGVTVGVPESYDDEQDDDTIVESEQAYDDQADIQKEWDEENYVDEEIERENQEIEDEIRSERMDYADSMERSREDGWFYGDDDEPDFDTVLDDYGYHEDYSDCGDDDLYDVSDEEMNYGNEDLDDEDS